MTWTYDSTSITTNLAKVRLRIGDTMTQDQLLTDEEINHYLGLYSSIDEAAAYCCEAIVAKLARDTTRSALGMSDSRNEMIQTYKDMAVRLRESHGSVADLTSTGDSVSAKETLTDDTDRVQPLFNRSRWDNATATDESES